MERSFQSAADRCVAGSADTRTRVLNAASDLFARRGFSGTSIAAIRAASGVLPSSIYWEFGSKQGILTAVLEESAGRWLDQLAESGKRAWAQSQADGSPALDACFANLGRQLTERPEFLRLLLLLALERREADPATIEAIRRVRARATAGLASAFRLGGFIDEPLSDEAVHELARLSLAFADGAFVAAQIDPDTVDLQRLFSLFYAGVAALLSTRIAARGTTV